MRNPVLRRQARKLRRYPDDWVIPYKNGKCPFLEGRKNQCTIYDSRPEVCRAFDCRSQHDFYRFIKLNPKVAALLKEQRHAGIKRADSPTPVVEG